MSYTIDKAMLIDAITIYIMEEANLNDMEDIETALHRAICDSLSLEYNPDNTSNIYIIFKTQDNTAVISKDHCTNLAKGTREEIPMSTKGHVGRLFKRIAADLAVLSAQDDMHLKAASETLDHMITSNNPTVRAILRRNLLNRIFLDYLEECQATQN